MSTIDLKTEDVVASGLGADTLVLGAAGGQTDAEPQPLVGTAVADLATLTGDVTKSSGSRATTLATVNSAVGSFGLAASVAQFTVNAKGLITAAANMAIQVAISAVTGLQAALDAKVALADLLRLKTDGEQVLWTSADTSVSESAAFFDVENHHESSGVHLRSYWAGTTASPYQNNDGILSDIFNDVQSNSTNLSWAGSFANAYSKIPAGVTDAGRRVGVIGWAPSIFSAPYKHEGTLSAQIGVDAVVGFQGAGSGASAVVTNATAVRASVLHDSAGSTVENAKAGEFVSAAVTGTVNSNMAVFAHATGGVAENYSFYGSAGEFYNEDRAHFGDGSLAANQQTTAISSRMAGNTLEFGHPDGSGYGSSIGATPGSGYPFLAFSAEAEASGNTFRTRGKVGNVIQSDLAGAIIFAKLTDANSAGQSITEFGRFNVSGNLVLSSHPPASAGATGQTGEIAWDSGFIYVCVSTNTWKRVAIATW